MNLNEFAKEVHALAVEKGFYETEPSDAELLAAIHSEISEAFEEWRAGRSMVYYMCDVDGEPCDNTTDCAQCDGGDCINGHRFTEPHGIAVELIDVVLRILDAAAAWNVEIGQINDVPMDILKKNVPEFVMLLHFEITYGRITTVISHIMEWIRTQGFNPEALLIEKHEYNKTRPYRHGGKRV